jgi:zinc transport system permease protein
VFEFWRELFHQSLALNALAMSLLASVSCGVVGAFVVVRRITYLAAGVAHSTLAGLGAAHFLRVRYGWEFLDPLHGAIAAAVLAALVIGWVTLRVREREDTVIGAVWAAGMASGILLIYKTPGYDTQLMSYLFGDILLVSSEDLWLILGLDAVVVGVTVLFFSRFQAICFDEEFARLRNLSVEAYFLLLLVLTAVTVVALVTVVGIVLVIALLTLPAAIAGRFTRSLAGMIIVSCLLCGLFSVLGVWFSYAPDLPSGPTIIVVAGVAYLFVLVPGFVRGRKRGRL